MLCTGRQVAVSDYPKLQGILRSDTGQTWSDINLVKFSGTILCYGNNILVMLGMSSGIGFSRVSKDYGSTWSSEVTLPSSADSIAFGNGIFIIASPYQTSVLTSSDGVNWVKRTAPIPSEYSSSVVFGNGTFVLISVYGSIATSLDGIEWTLRGKFAGNSSLDALGYQNKIFLCTYNRRIYRSVNGVDWVIANSSFDDIPKSFAFGHSIYLALCSNGNTHSSIDGIDWNPANFALSASSGGVKIIFGNGLFVAIYAPSSSTTASYKFSMSLDGEMWYVPKNNPRYARDIIYLPDMFLCVGGSAHLNKSISQGLMYLPNNFIQPTYIKAK